MTHLCFFSCSKWHTECGTHWHYQQFRASFLFLPLWLVREIILTCVDRLECAGNNSIAYWSLHSSILSVFSLLLICLVWSTDKICLQRTKKSQAKWQCNSIYTRILWPSQSTSVIPARFKQEDKIWSCDLEKINYIRRSFRLIETNYWINCLMKWVLIDFDLISMMTTYLLTYYF